MSKTLQRILTLVGSGEIRISDHGYNELSEDNIFTRDIIAGVSEAIVVEDYPAYPKAPVFWYCKKIMAASQSMLCGGFRKMLIRPPRLLPPTDPIRINGQTIF